ncbi:MAG: FIST C-terminal domain-containing protein [Bdellovibrionales bacterium]|nr:FIST C-terminal domain-containing protein [Bdellovibrionales bacterium]
MIKRGAVLESDAATAAKLLAEQLAMPRPAAVLFFCSSTYDPAVLSAALQEHFACPLIGATSAGEIAARYQTNGLVGVALPEELFRAEIRFIDNLAATDSAALAQTVREMMGALSSRAFAPVSSTNTVGLLLIDGLARQEERFVASVHDALKGIALVGGSAGDNLQFEKTVVYADELYGTGAAAIALLHTSLACEVFQLKHFEPSETEMVITKADPQTRTVFEIDGGPAAEQYAALLGLSAKELGPAVFSKHPVMLQIGDDWYVRSIAQMNSDASLQFFCAIEEGLPLTIGKSTAFVETLEQQVAALESRFDEIHLTIGCDCILRRLEIEQKQLFGDVEALLQRLRFLGFSTYGEQFNSIHVNQTLTGVTFGKRRNTL